MLMPASNHTRIHAEGCPEGGARHMCVLTHTASPWGWGLAASGMVCVLERSLERAYPDHWLHLLQLLCELQPPYSKPVPVKPSVRTPTRPCSLLQKRPTTPTRNTTAMAAAPHRQGQRFVIKQPSI